MERQQGLQEFGGEGSGRPLLGAMLRGAACTCPNCGKGALFQRFLTVNRTCEACGEELYHHRADDLPAYLNIFLTGHVVVGAMVMVLVFELLPLWPATALTVLVAVAAAFVFMRPLKGLVVGAQWALGMHGFGGHAD
jgi:uncharacterized protein (DUF983 family)